MHILYLTSAERDVLAESLEQLIGEAKEVLKDHEADDPPVASLFDLNIVEGAEAYLTLIETQKGRIAALEAIKGRL